MGLANSAMTEVAIFWFRRDLRLDDNAGLYHALKNSKNILPLFIFDTDILEKLSDYADPRVTFIYNQVEILHQQFSKSGSTLIAKIGKPVRVFESLLLEFKISAVYTNHDYEPYAYQRDHGIADLLNSKNIPFFTFKDQVIFEKNEVHGEGGKNYRVYTPYKNKWLQKLNDFYLRSYPVEKYIQSLYESKQFQFPSLEQIGFQKSKLFIPDREIIEHEISSYDKTRDYPFKETTSKLGIHLRFGTVSIRKIVNKARELNETWLSELIWREFFMQLLYHYPDVVQQSFNPRFKNMQWRHDEYDFQKWCEGKTGYPLVDAGMRELNATHYMHNRVRLVVASFLTKHLLIDWKWGEAYFAQKLLDYELSSNNGNWQWSAGTGADAQPFFRIFNPILQQQKFDPDFKYIQKWVPEYGSSAYSKPMIDHKIAVTRAKEAFGLLK